MPKLHPFIRPMLAKPGRPFDSQEHLFEVKWDGLRAMLYLDQNGYRIIGRRGRPLNDQFPELASFQHLAPGTVLDGEMVVLRHGKPSLGLVQARQQAQAAAKIHALAKVTPATYIAFDQLFDGYRSLMDRPLAQRREMLARTVARADQERIIVSAGIVGPGKAFYQQVVRERLEGVMAKRLTGRYLPGRRSELWLKIKWLVQPPVGAVPGAITYQAAENDRWNSPQPTSGSRR